MSHNNSYLVHNALLKGLGVKGEQVLACRCSRNRPIHGKRSRVAFVHALLLHTHHSTILNRLRCSKWRGHHRRRHSGSGRGTLGKMIGHRIGWDGGMTEHARHIGWRGVGRCLIVARRIGVWIHEYYGRRCIVIARRVDSCISQQLYPQNWKARCFTEFPSIYGIGKRVCWDEQRSAEREPSIERAKRGAKEGSGRVESHA